MNRGAIYVDNILPTSMAIYNTFTSIEKIEAKISMLKLNNSKAIQPLWLWKNSTFLDKVDATQCESMW